MKRLYVSVILCALCGSALSADKTAKKDGLNAASSASAKRRALYAKHFGGMFVKPGSQLGEVAVINCQNAIGTDVFSMPLDFLDDEFGLNMKVVPSAEPFTPATASAAMKNAGGNMAVFVVNDPSLPMSLVAVEAGWGAINVAPLLDEKKPRTAERFSKEFLRVFAMTCGASDSAAPGCLMIPVKGVLELDLMKARVYSPEPYEKIRFHGAAYGLRGKTLVSYKRACEEGWAPAPTNDVQKAIWDKIHTMPTDPIKIKYDPKRDK